MTGAPKASASGKRLMIARGIEAGYGRDALRLGAREPVPRPADASNTASWHASREWVATKPSDWTLSTQDLQQPPCIGQRARCRLPRAGLANIWSHRKDSGVRSTNGDRD